jgi:mRNA-degrading endonuclease toxin of MazEF toxin-antitoxin module
MGVVVSRFDVFLVNLDPTVGSEIRKTRPCVIISPDEMNRFIRTVIIAPLTSKGRSYPTRVACRFDKKDADRQRILASRLDAWSNDRNADEVQRILGAADARFSLLEDVLAC